MWLKLWGRAASSSAPAPRVCHTRGMPGAAMWVPPGYWRWIPLTARQQRRRVRSFGRLAGQEQRKAAYAERQAAAAKGAAEEAAADFGAEMPACVEAAAQTVGGYPDGRLTRANVPARVEAGVQTDAASHRDAEPSTAASRSDRTK